MTGLPDFRLETHFAKWEFKAKYHMTASDAESMSLNDLLSMATDADREAFDKLWLGYTETYGEPELRTIISKMFDALSSENILCFAGASEGIFAANTVLLDRDSHAIVVTPNYQSHETLPSVICNATGIPLDPKDGWSLDIDRLANAIQKNTRLININFPHNPTGANLDESRLNRLVEVARHHGVYILSDEIFRGLGPTGTAFAPPIADLYEKGLSLNVMSKAYGLPGLRIGWIGCQNKDLLSRMERMKHYLSICNSSPAEQLTKIALKNRDRILARNCQIIDQNLQTLNAFFERYADRFQWRQPDASCIGFPKYLGTEGVETFATRLIQEHGLLILPGSIYRSDLTTTPTDHFRIGFGRSNMGPGLQVLADYLNAQ